MKGQNLNGKGTQPALQGVSETLFIPVWARAMETRRPDSLIQDTYALRIMGDHAGLQEKYRGAWLSQIGIIARTRALDRVASQFLASCPHGTVISLGCGLDARSRRLDNGIARWVDVDLPEVIAHRRLYFEDGPRHSSLSGSALGHGWIEEIAPPIKRRGIDHSRRAPDVFQRRGSPRPAFRPGAAFSRGAIRFRRPRKALCRQGKHSRHRVEMLRALPLGSRFL